MKKFLLALGLWAATASGAFCQGTIPVALTQQINQNGQPLAGALLFTFVQGTVAQQQSTFQDTGLTILNPWPLQADQNGRIPMFYMASGSTHVRLTDTSGNVQFDYPNMLVIGPAGGGGGGGGSVDPTTILATGDLKVKYGTGSLTGFVRANGLTIGTPTSGATERANSDTQNLFIYLYNTDPNLVVSGGRTGNALNDFNANKTIALPDWRGKAIFALADMGNSATAGFTSIFAGCTPTTLGAACGSQSHLLAASELPAHTHPNTLTDPGHSHSINGGTTEGTQVGVQGEPNATGSIANTNSATTGITINNMPNTGGGSAHSIVPPAMLATIYVKL